MSATVSMHLICVCNATAGVVVTFFSILEKCGSVS